MGAALREPYALPTGRNGTSAPCADRHTDHHRPDVVVECAFGMGHPSRVTSRQPPLRSSAVPAALCAACVVLGAGCRTMAPLPEGVAARYAETASEGPPYARRTVDVALRASDSGLTLSGVLVSGPGQARLQLFPDFGPAALDLWVGKAGIFSRASGPLEALQPKPELSAPPGQAPKTEIEAFARTLERIAQPLRPGELGLATEEGAKYVVILPAAGGLDIRAEIDRQGQLRAYRFARFGASWRAERVADGWRVDLSERELTLRLGSPEPLEPQLRRALEPPNGVSS